MFKWLFAVPPKIGSVWAMSKDPFDRMEVVVLAVKDGYVQYENINGYKYKRSLTIRQFHACYEEVIFDEDVEA